MVLVWQEPSFSSRGCLHSTAFNRASSVVPCCCPINLLFSTPVKAKRQGAACHFAATGMTTGTTTVVQTTAYIDVMAMQKILLLVYVPLPTLLAMPVSEVCQKQEAELFKLI